MVEYFGDQVLGNSVKIKVPGLGSTDIDVLLTGNRYIEVGGPAKAMNLAKFGRQLQILDAYAKLNSGQAYFYYDKGTPQEAIDLAIKWLGIDYVPPIPGK